MDKARLPSKCPNTTYVESLVSCKACKTNNTRQGPVLPLRGSSGVWYELHVQFFTTRDDIRRFYRTDKHILPDREPDTNELLVTQDRELGTGQCKQVLNCELNKQKPNIYITTTIPVFSQSILSPGWPNKN